MQSRARGSPSADRVEDGKKRKEGGEMRWQPKSAEYNSSPTLSYSFLSDPAALMLICSISGWMHGDGRASRRFKVEQAPVFKPGGARQAAACPRPNSPCRAGTGQLCFIRGGPDASTHTRTVPRPVGALAAHAAAEMLGVQHRLAPGRTIIACPGPNANLGGCPASPVRVRWATPCHPPRHGSRPGVCFLSLISVPPQACYCV